MEVISIERSTYEVIGFAASLVEEHPMKSHQPFYDSSSGAKVIICFELAKLSFSFFNKMYFFIFYHI